jgi:hypothetical protein
VLENHHAATSFKVMKEENCDFMENLSFDEYNSTRLEMVECILNTDNSLHFSGVAEMKNKNN